MFNFTTGKEATSDNTNKEFAPKPYLEDSVSRETTPFGLDQQHKGFFETVEIGKTKIEFIKDGTHYNGLLVEDKNINDYSLKVRLSDNEYYDVPVRDVRNSWE